MSLRYAGCGHLANEMGMRMYCNLTESHIPSGPPHSVIHHKQNLSVLRSTESFPVSDPMSRQDAHHEKEGGLIDDNRPPTLIQTITRPQMQATPVRSTTCSRDGRVHDLFGVAAGLSIRHQSFLRMNTKLDHDQHLQCSTPIFLSKGKQTTQIVPSSLHEIY